MPQLKIHSPSPFNEFRFFHVKNRVFQNHLVLVVVGGRVPVVSPKKSVCFFLSGYDLVIDCTDAPPSRYLLNDAALDAARPLIAASAVG